MKYIILSVLFALVLPLGAHAAIARDTATSAYSGQDVTSLSYTHTVGSGKNRIVWVIIQAFTNNLNSPFIPSYTSVTFAGSSMTLANSSSYSDAGGGAKVAMYYLVNPPVGADTVSISTSATVHYGITALSTSYTGVNQSTPTDSNNATDGSLTGSSFTSTVSVNSSSNWIVGGINQPTASVAGTNDWSGKYVNYQTPSGQQIVWLDTNGADGSTGTRTVGANNLNTGIHLMGVVATMLAAPTTTFAPWQFFPF